MLFKGQLYHNLGDLNDRGLLPQFWGLVVHDRGVREVALSEDSEGGSVPGCSPCWGWFAGTLWHLLGISHAIPIPTFISPGVLRGSGSFSIPRFPLFIRTPVILGVLQRTHLDYPFDDSISK